MTKFFTKFYLSLKNLQKQIIYIFIVFYTTHKTLKHITAFKKHPLLLPLIMLLGFFSIFILKFTFYSELSLNDKYLNILKVTSVLYFILLILINLSFIKDNMFIFNNNNFKIKLISVIYFHVKLFSVLIIFQFILNILIFKDDFNILRNLILNFYLIIFMYSILLLFYFNVDSNKKKNIINIINNSLNYAALFTIIISLFKILSVTFNILYSCSSGYVYADSTGSSNMEISAIVRETDIISLKNNIQNLNLTSYLNLTLKDSELEQAITHISKENALNLNVAELMSSIGYSSNYDDGPSIYFSALLEHKLSILNENTLSALNLIEKTNLIKLQFDTLNIEYPLYNYNTEHLAGSLTDVDNFLFNKDILYSETHYFFNYSVQRAILLNNLDELVLGYIEIFENKEVRSENLSIITLIKLYSHLSSLNVFYFIKNEEYIIKLETIVNNYHEIIKKIKEKDEEMT